MEEKYKKMIIKTNSEMDLMHLDNLITKIGELELIEREEKYNVKTGLGEFTLVYNIKNYK